MKHVLTCIAESFIWLFQDRDFRLFDSGISPKGAGWLEGWVEARNAHLAVRFISDRDHVYWAVYGIQGWSPETGVTMDLIERLLTGSFSENGMIDKQTENFLKVHYETIEKLFLENDPVELQQKIKKLKRERAKRFFD